MLKKKSLPWLIAALLLACTVPAGAATLPEGAVYCPGTEESGLKNSTTGIYLFSADGLAEVYVGGIRLAPGEARSLTGKEELLIVPGADGSFETVVRYALLEDNGSLTVHSLPVAYMPCTAELPQAEDSSRRVFHGIDAIGRLDGSSPYGDVTYRIEDEPKKGRVLLSGGYFHYYPYDGRYGSDCFSYTVTDRLGQTSACGYVDLYIEEALVRFDDIEDAVLEKEAVMLYEATGLFKRYEDGGCFFDASKPATPEELSAAAAFLRPDTALRDGVTRGELAALTAASLETQRGSILAGVLD